MVQKNLKTFLKDKMKQCQYCGKQATDHHHCLGRNQPDSEKESEKIWYCRECHNIAECRDYVDLPFTNYQIQGELFDIYVKTGDIEKILKLIKMKKFKNLYKKI